MKFPQGMLGIAGGVLLALSAGCKKEPGSEQRENVATAGYELDQSAFFRAAESDDLKALDGMMAAGMEIGTRDAGGRTALHAAAGAGAIKAVDFLLDRGLEIDADAGDGRTPLMEAVVRSTPETVRHLLRQGADPRLKDAKSFKPLMLAVEAGRAEMIGELAPYVREDLDDSLLAAAIWGQARVIDELTNFGASIYARLEDGRTPLMLAAQKGQSEAAELLLAIGANRFAMDGDGKMASDLAREAGFDDLARRLAGAPLEGDFELVEPAELGGEMVARVMRETDPAGTETAIAPTLADPAPGPPPPGGDGPVAAVDGGDPDLPWNTPVPGQAGGDAGGIAAPAPQARVEVLEGAVVGGAAASARGGSPDAAAAGAVDGPLVMRSYRQRELPLRVESTTTESVRLRIAGGTAVEVPVGTEVPGSALKVIRIERRLRSGKADDGEPTEVSVVTVGDGENGIERELVVGLPALAHEPVALVEDAASGRYYVARTGQRFRSDDGRDFLVGDVRPNQVVIEEISTGETTTLWLRGSRG